MFALLLSGEFLMQIHISFILNYWLNKTTIFILGLTYNYVDWNKFIMYNIIGSQFVVFLSLIDLVPIQLNC